MVLLDSSIHPTSAVELKDITDVANQEPVPLSSIAINEKTNRTTSGMRKDGEEYVRISIEVDSKNLYKISNEITVKTRELALTGVTINSIHL